MVNMRKILLVLAVFTSMMSFASDKIYMSFDDVDESQNEFHFHIGQNEWLKTNTIHRDITGLYTLESDIFKNEDIQAAYEKTWKCPFCFHHWRMDQACENAQCPSKNKPK